LLSLVLLQLHQKIYPFAAPQPEAAESVTSRAFSWAELAISEAISFVLSHVSPIVWAAASVVPPTFFFVESAVWSAFSFVVSFAL
jgi:hypothetical protein